MGSAALIGPTSGITPTNEPRASRSRAGSSHPLGIAATGGCTGGTNGHQMVVADFPDVARSKGDRGLGATRGGYEFHLDGRASRHQRPRPDRHASAPEPEGPCSARRRQVRGSSQAISRICGHEPRYIAPSRDKPDADDNGRLSGRSIQDSANRVFLALIRGTNRLAVLGQVLDAQRVDRFTSCVLPSCVDLPYPAIPVTSRASPG
jgi:hypothetical protein